MTFWYGSESADPYLCLTDPDADPGGPKHTGHKDPDPDPDPEHWYKVIKKSHKTVEIEVSLSIFA